MKKSKTPIIVQIICDAGSSVGLGHLSRMIFLGIELNKNNNFKCSISILTSNEIYREQLNKINHQFYNGSLSQTVEEVIHNYYPDFIIYDLSLEKLSHVNRSLFENVRKFNSIQIGIDNLIRFSEHIDFTLVPAFRINNQSIKYINNNVSWGWNSFLLPLPKILKTAKNNKLLVLTGSSDTARLSQFLPTHINDYLIDEIEINWVQGPMAEAPIVPKNPRHQWKIHLAPDGLEFLMKECSYGLSVYGVSLFELISFQVPTVTLSPYGGKDDEDMKALEDLGIVLSASNAEQSIQKLNKLIINTNLYHDIQHSCRGLMQKSGSEIISEFIYSAIIE